MVEGGEPYGLKLDASIAVIDGRVEWVGPMNEWPLTFNHVPPKSLNGALVTPALIDCHTHLIYGGNRSAEFEMRLNNVGDEEISRAGGGIMSTVIATRQASDEELLSQSLSRLDHLISEGVAIVEIKSGYGLSIEQEIRMLKIARRLETLRPVKILTTWLAAHAFPPEYKTKPDDYIDEVVIPGLITASKLGLVDAVDGFCENIGFSTSQIERVFKAARSLNLPVKLHAEQLSDMKGALLASKYDALSADHLEYLDANDVNTFAKSRTVAVLLPGAYYSFCARQNCRP